MPDTANNLTARQRQVLAALRRLHERDGYPPSLREVADEVGLASASSVHHHVRGLEAQGVIARRPYHPRTVTVEAGPARPAG